MFKVIDIFDAIQNKLKHKRIVRLNLCSHFLPSLRQPGGYQAKQEQSKNGSQNNYFQTYCRLGTFVANMVAHVWLCSHIAFISSRAAFRIIVESIFVAALWKRRLTT